MKQIATVLFLVALISPPALSVPCNVACQNEHLADEITKEFTGTGAPKTWSAMPASGAETLKTKATKYVAGQLAGIGYKEFIPTASSPAPGFVVHLMVTVSPKTLTTYLFAVKMNGVNIAPGKEVVLGIPQFTATNPDVSRTMAADDIGLVTLKDANMAKDVGLDYFRKTICADPVVRLMLDEILGENPKIAHSRDLIEGSYAGVPGTYVHLVFWCTE